MTDKQTAEQIIEALLDIRRDALQLGNKLENILNLMKNSDTSWTELPPIEDIAGVSRVMSSAIYIQCLNWSQYLQWKEEE